MSEIRSQYRFFVDAACIENGHVTFPDSVGRQLTRVLRLRTGSAVVVLDGSGREFFTLLEIRNTSVTGQVDRIEMNRAEPRLRLHLFLAIPKMRKLESALRQCTEVGVAEFTPVVSHYVATGADRRLRFERMKEIIREAAEQCGRGRMPSLNPPAQLIDAVGRSTCGYFFSHELDEYSKPSIDVPPDSDLPPDSAAQVFIGPEGGFSTSERRFAVDSGLSIMSMGPRTFRVDTAAAVSCALLLRRFCEI